MRKPAPWTPPVRGEAEGVLFEAWRAAAAGASAAAGEERYADALQALASMRGAVDRYFDDVLVMAEDETVRRNRLRQLAGIAGGSVRKVAHLERLQG